MTNFIKACELGNLEKIKLSFCSNTCKNYGVQIASQFGHLDIVKYLTSQGADIQDQSNLAVQQASQFGHLEIVKYLVSQGANIKADNDYSLQLACENGHVEVVKYITSQEYIKHSLQISCVYALELACENGHLEVVKYLVSQGLHFRTNEACLVQWASRNGHLEIVKYFVSQGACIRSDHDLAIRWALENDHLELVKYLLSQGVPIARISENKKALHYISFCKRMEENIKIRAQKIIYYWWIPICYNMLRECGQRMAQKNLESYKEIINLK